MNIDTLNTAPAAFGRRAPVKYKNIRHYDTINNKKTANQDTITIKINKKKAIAGGAAMLTAVAGLAAYAVSGKYKTIQANKKAGQIAKEISLMTQEVGEHTSEIIKDFTKIYGNLHNKYNQLFESNKTEDVIDDILVKLEYGKKSATLSEYTKDGSKLLRKTTFEESKLPCFEDSDEMYFYLKQIREYSEGTNKYNQIIFGERLTDTKPAYVKACMEGVEEFKNGTTTADKVFEFQNFVNGKYKISKYAKNAKLTADSTWTGKQNLYFENNKPIQYIISDKNRQIIYGPENTDKWTEQKQ